jgi:hypothetical protein
MTDAVKVSMLHHARYEIEHCMVIPRCRAEARFTRESIFLSFFVHARSLMHFFERTRTAKSDDDVYASDFGFPSTTIPISPEDRIRFGKDMMHITTKRERHTAATKAWPILSVYTAIKPVTTRFSAHVIAHYAERLSEHERRAWSKLHSALEASGDSMLVVDEEPNKAPEPTP